MEKEQEKATIIGPEIGRPREASVAPEETDAEEGHGGEKQPQQRGTGRPRKASAASLDADNDIQKMQEGEGEAKGGGRGQNRLSQAYVAPLKTDAEKHTAYEKQQKLAGRGRRLSKASVVPEETDAEEGHGDQQQQKLAGRGRPRKACGP